jgi:hypothetical protein
MELEHFLSEHGVDICHLKETHLESGRALKFPNYVYHQTNRQTFGGGKTILVHKCIDHYEVPVLGLQYPKAPALHLALATRPVNLVSACLSPTRPLIESELTEVLSGGIPVQITDDLNAKHTDWKSSLITARGSLLRDYADGNCLTYGRIPQPRLLTRTTPLPSFLI